MRERALEQGRPGIHERAAQRRLGRHHGRSAARTSRSGSPKLPDLSNSAKPRSSPGNSQGTPTASSPPSAGRHTDRVEHRRRGLPAGHDQAADACLHEVPGEPRHCLLHDRGCPRRAPVWGRAQEHQRRLPVGLGVSGPRHPAIRAPASGSAPRIQPVRQHPPPGALDLFQRRRRAAAGEHRYRAGQRLGRGVGTPGSRCHNMPGQPSRTGHHLDSRAPSPRLRRSPSVMASATA